MMDPFTIGTAISVGSRAIGGLSSLLQGPVEPIEPAWGAMRSRFERELRKSIRGTVGEGADRLRLEAARTGTSMAGTYLGALTEVQKRATDIISRELTSYDLQQEQQRTQWEMGKSSFMAQQTLGRQQILPQMLEGIGGDIAGYFTGQGMRQERTAVGEAARAERGGTTELLQNQNDLLRQLLEQYGFSAKVNNAIRPYTTSSSYKPSPMITPMPSSAPIEPYRGG